MLPAEPGVYVLVLRCSASGTVRIGRLGALAVRPGFYLYVGSARGPGGIRARVEHHSRRASSPHWHIDYLRRRARLIEVWHAAEAGEHALAATVGALPGAGAPMPRFGSSDCECRTHLFWFAALPPIPLGLSRVSLGG